MRLQQPYTKYDVWFHYDSFLIDNSYEWVSK